MGKKKEDPDDPESGLPKERVAISCSVCGATNFRKCNCPWDKPFQTWPPQYAFIKDLDWPSDID